MIESQENATTAALRQLGIPVQTTVVVAGPCPPGSPSEGKLRRRRDRRGRRHAGRPAGRRCATLITAHKPGDTVAVVVRRDGKQRDARR